MILLLLQIFYTFLIVIDWFSSLEKTEKTHQVFQGNDSIGSLFKHLVPLAYQESKSLEDYGSFGFGDIDVASSYRSNLI